MCQYGDVMSLTRPLVAMLSVCLDDHCILPLAEGVLLHLGIELIAPPTDGIGASGAAGAAWWGMEKACRLQRDTRSSYRHRTASPSSMVF